MQIYTLSVKAQNELAFFKCCYVEIRQEFGWNFLDSYFQRGST